jgi:hypothetical protein
MTSASRSSLTPERRGEAVDRADEQVRPADDAGEREQHLEVDDPQPGDGGVDVVATAVRLAEPERREVAVGLPRLRVEVPLHVPHVDPDETTATRILSCWSSGGRNAAPIAIA